MMNDVAAKEIHIRDLRENRKGRKEMDYKKER